MTHTMLCIKDSVIFKREDTEESQSWKSFLSVGGTKKPRIFLWSLKFIRLLGRQKKSDLKIFFFFLIFNLNDKVHSKYRLMTRRIGMNSFYRTSNITWQLHVVIQNMLSKKHKNWLHLSDGVITRKLSSTPLETMDPLQWGKVRSCVCRRYKSFDYRKLLS